ncbi:acyloxyacyl hydrolase [Stenotrophomonas sp. 24(2023)]|uniref:acyloxyacyl hydrolase n=1 Tax=Stenotrophomonas sp. 24(2023) TaxID=3068324 RepID=UPI0027E1C19A|nr:acyloxyacyl hydrolase [Stenotrophomonas sp. 24(2023)]WMJ69474.1 acyloxyacyl hydrolase [Stenotrophomonas sp. 24(2023)]
MPASRKFLRGFRSSVACLLLPALLHLPTALASERPAVAVQAGEGLGDYRRASLLWQSAPQWHWQGSSGQRVDLTLELGLARWQGNDEQHQHAWQANAIPLFRWHLHPRVFVEAGVGATVFDRTRVGGRRISTAWQFGDHLGVGMRVDDRQRVSLRWSHYSNASIKRPNPGLDVIQLTWAVAY